MGHNAMWGSGVQGSAADILSLFLNSCAVIALFRLPVRNSFSKSKFGCHPPWPGRSGFSGVGLQHSTSRSARECFVRCWTHLQYPPHSICSRYILKQKVPCVATSFIGCASFMELITTGALHFRQCRALGTHDAQNRSSASRDLYRQSRTDGSSKKLKNCK